MTTRMTDNNNQAKEGTLRLADSFGEQRVEVKVVVADGEVLVVGSSRVIVPRIRYSTLPYHPTLSNLDYLKFRRHY